MPLALLTQIPFLYRIMAIILMAIALYGTGRIQGMHSEHDKMELAQKKAEDKLIADTAKISKQLTDDALKAKAERDALRQKSSVLADQVKALQSKSKKYQTECVQDEDVLQKLREAASK